MQPCRTPSPRRSRRRSSSLNGLLSLLAEHVRRYRAGDDPDRWLFPNGKDEALPMHAATAAYLWRKACRRAGVSCRLHDCRHFFASGLIAAGCDVVTVQRALGHSSASTTLGVYAHIWPNANDRTRRAAGELLAASLGTAADAAR